MSDLLLSEKRSSREPYKVTGKTVLVYLIVFFAVVASANAVMMTLALKTMPGVDVKSAYEASQNYNVEIARAREQEERGWRANVALNADKGERQIVINFVDKTGAPVRGLTVQARLAHPADRKADIAAEAHEIAPGIYSARFATAHGGAWDLVIEGRQSGRDIYRSRSRIRL